LLITKIQIKEVPEVEAGCRSGALGCVDCKMNCTSKISEMLAPIIAKRKYYEQHINEVKDILDDGEKREKTAQATMTEVREKNAIGIAKDV
jgi:tryptophanyl-tRNA synthetase